MLTSTIVISGLIVLGVGSSIWFASQRKKNEELKKEVNLYKSKPYEFKSQNTPTYNPIQNSTTRLTSSTLKSSTTIYRSNNHTNNTSNLLNTIITVDVIDSLSDDHKHSYHYSTPSYESHSHDSSSSHSSYDSGGSYDSGSYDCGWRD